MVHSPSTALRLFDHLPRILGQIFPKVSLIMLLENIVSER